MTRAELERIVRTWQRRLGLERWRVELVTDEARWFRTGHDDEHASTWRSNSYDQARLYVNPDEWRDWSPHDAHEHVVHELVHLLHRDLEHVLDHVEPLLHADAYKVAESALEHALEQTVDRIARRLVELAGDEL